MSAIVSSCDPVLYPCEPNSDPLLPNLIPLQSYFIPPATQPETPCDPVLYLLRHYPRTPPPPQEYLILPATLPQPSCDPRDHILNPLRPYLRTPATLPYNSLPPYPRFPATLVLGRDKRFCDHCCTLKRPSPFHGSYTYGCLHNPVQIE